jgi:hypothetical protein
MFISFLDEFKANLFETNSLNFEEKALQLFKYQAVHNKIYALFLQYLKKDFQKINSIQEIPFLPIDFFKYHTITTHEFDPVKIFESSGTTLQTKSKHFIKDFQFYLEVTQRIFENFYGNLQDFYVLALLPSYLERGNSSLVAMADFFIQKTNSQHSGFYLNDLKNLSEKLSFLHQKNDRKILLLGVSFALLDLAEQFPQPLPNLLIMETGGMKGKRTEITRQSLHTILQNAFDVKKIHSEYGMTELLSQGYAKGGDIFETPAWLQIFLRETNDPLSMPKNLKKGAINVIDLANINSCAFIATQDLGEKIDNHFKVLGRVDSAEIRGCNLLYYDF